jgi:hypothetical protein
LADGWAWGWEAEEGTAFQPRRQHRQRRGEAGTLGSTAVSGAQVTGGWERREELRDIWGNRWKLGVLGSVGVLNGSVEAGTPVYTSYNLRTMKAEVRTVWG